MAQYFYSFENGMPPNTEIIGGTTATIIEDANASTGYALELTRDAGGGDRGLVLNEPEASTTEGDPFEVVVRMRRPSTIHLQFVNFSRLRFFVTEDAVQLIRRLSTVVASVSHTVNRAEYYSVRLIAPEDADGRLAAAKIWQNESEPEDWGFEHSETDPGATGDPRYFINLTSTIGAPPAYIDYVGIGTYGDPAPTGPVSAIAVPSPVIDTVTSNSIKWVW